MSKVRQITGAATPMTGHTLLLAPVCANGLLPIHRAPRLVGARASKRRHPTSERRRALRRATLLQALLFATLWLRLRAEFQSLQSSPVQTSGTGMVVAHHRPLTLERSMTAPVASKATAMMRLRLSAATRCARRAPNHAATACAGATDAQTARSILPSCVGAEPPEANAATRVAGRLTTTPAAAARPRDGAARARQPGAERHRRAGMGLHL